MRIMRFVTDLILNDYKTGIVGLKKPVLFSKKCLCISEHVATEIILLINKVTNAWIYYVNFTITFKNELNIKQFK